MPSAEPRQVAQGRSLSARRRWLRAGLASAGIALTPVLRGAHANPTGGNRGESALVIGNARYRQAALNNPVNDARLIGQALGGIGIRVRLIEDAGLQTMLDSVRQWLQNEPLAPTRIFYFAGHGMQSKGRNYLLPVDAEILSEADLQTQAFNVSDLVDRLARIDQGVNIVILDACRNLPVPSGVLRPKGRSAAQDESGLAAMAAPKGTLVAYSTSPGAVAADGAGRENSTYTRHLAAQMSVTGMPIEVVFKKVREAVLNETQNNQMPWETSSLVGEFCLRPSEDGRCDAPRSSGRVVDLRALQGGRQAGR